MIYLANLLKNSNYHMLYVDQPVGTGYSYTDSESGILMQCTAVLLNNKSKVMPQMKKK